MKLTLAEIVEQVRKETLNHIFPSRVKLKDRTPRQIASFSGAATLFDKPGYTMLGYLGLKVKEDGLEGFISDGFGGLSDLSFKVFGNNYTIPMPDLSGAGWGLLDFGFSGLALTGLYYGYQANSYIYPLAKASYKSGKKIAKKTYTKIKESIEQRKEQKYNKDTK